MSQPLVLFSGSAGTGSTYSVGEIRDTALLVQISGTVATFAVTLFASLGNGTASGTPLSCFNLSASSEIPRQTVLSSVGQYYYPYVAGLSIFTTSTSSFGGLPGSGIYVIGQPIIK